MKDAKMFNIGDNVKLKESRNGRYYPGKIIKISNGLIRVAISNGLYAEFPIDMWEKV